MKTYELSEEQIEMIVDALDFSIDALEETKKHCDKIAQRINVDCRIDNITAQIGELTTLKNYLEQY
jgi:hypothetical protein